MGSVRTGIIAATTEDSHGEKYDLDFLKFLQESTPEKFPLHQQHDMARPIIGYALNPRIVPLENSPDEWALIVDLEIPEDLDSNLRGLSWAVTQMIRANRENPEAALYLPYPHYKDENQLRWFLEQNHPVAVGRYVRKGADPVTVALLSILLAPLWNSVWNDVLYPIVKRQLPKLRELWQRNVSTDLSLKVKTSAGTECTVYFIPERGGEEKAFLEHCIKEGLKGARESLEKTWLREGRDIRMVKLIFEPSEQRYHIFYLQYENGEVIHLIPEPAAEADG